MAGFTTVPQSIAVHADLAVGQRDLGHLGHDGAKGFVQRDAPSTACGQWRSPARFVGHQLQHSGIARRVFQQLQAEGERVLFCGSSQFVDEAFREEGVVRMAHRAPKADGHARLGGHMAHVLAGKTVGQIEQAFGGGFVRHVDGS